MKIELLYFENCPGYGRLLERLPSLLRATGVSAPLKLREIVDDKDAQREGFLGSPSLRIDGHDVEPGAAQRADYGLKCRVYQTSGGLSGVPPDEWILAGLRGSRPG